MEGVGALLPPERLLGSGPRNAPSGMMTRLEMWKWQVRRKVMWMWMTLPIKARGARRSARRSDRQWVSLGAFDPARARELE